MKSILLIGLGRFGRHIAMKLDELHHHVMAVDKEDTRVDAVLPFVTNAQIGVSLKEIIHKTENFKHVNLNIYPDESINEDCKKILDAIEGFEYHINGRMFYWSIGRMNGSCPWPTEMETEIIRQHPTDKWELISILS